MLEKSNCPGLDLITERVMDVINVHVRMYTDCMHGVRFSREILEIRIHSMGFAIPSIFSRISGFHDFHSHLHNMNKL